MILDNPYASGSLRVQNDITASSAEFTGTVNVTGTLNATVEGTAATASYIELANVDGSGSLASRIEAQEQFSASLDATYATDAQVLAVSSSLSGSLAVDIASNLSSIGDLQTDSGSFSTRVTAVEGGVSSLNSATSSYLQNTTDTLDGDLTVTGTITAQEFHTEFVSASIIYQSGSTKFGDSADDVHSFTGSISSTGNITIDNTRPDITLLESDTSNTNTLIRHQTSLFRIDTINDAQDTITRRFTVDHTNGKVGIGTETPGDLLDVSQPADGTQAIRVYNSSTGTSANARFYAESDSSRIDIGAYSAAYNLISSWADAGAISTGTASSGGLILNSQNGGIKFQIGTSEKMRVHTNGNVGINETSPSAPIHISKQTTWGTTTNRAITINNTGTGGDVNAEHNMGSITWYSGNSLPTAEIAAYRNVPAAGNNIELVFKTYSQSLGSTVEAMRIDKVGNVGIGTTNPTEKFVVNGPVVWQGALAAGQTSSGVLDRAGDDLRIRAYGATAGTGNLVFRTGGGGGSVDSEAMRIDSSQNIGIGVTPYTNTLGSSNGIDFINNGGLFGYANGLYITANLHYDLDWKYKTTNPGGVFLVQGDILTYRNTASGTAGTIPSALTERFRIDSNGNVGIGTTSPAEKLDTNGAIRVNNYVSADSNFISYNQKAYYTDAWRKTSSGRARQLQMGEDSGGSLEYRISNVAGGAAGDAISWTSLIRVLDTGGITFNGDTAAANALDDYEEGTFSTTVVGITASTNSVTGTYTKVGNIVTAHFLVTITGKTGGTGNPYIALPFTADGTNIGTSNLGSYQGKNTIISGLAYMGLYGSNGQVYANTSSGGYIGQSSWGDGQLAFAVVYRAL